MSATVVEPKRGADVGRVVVPVTVENYDDLLLSRRGELPGQQVRRITVDALVDSGATYMCLPMGHVQRLGLAFLRYKDVRSPAGPLRLGLYGPAHVIAQGRDCITEVMAIADERQALLGQIPLEMMDWWIDLTNQKLAGNPEHGGEWMADAPSIW
jgi:hypothetical protein